VNLRALSGPRFAFVKEESPTHVLLQHKLSVKLSQRQILTPGLVQMVSVLALNKLELKDMINSEMVENPVSRRARRIRSPDRRGWPQEEDRDRLTTKTFHRRTPITAEKKDPFEEIDFGSFFQDYLDPAIAPAARWRKSNVRRSRTSSPSPPISPITSPGKWRPQPSP